MASDPPGNGLLWYLAGVAGLSGVTIFLLVVLFLTRVPSFTRAFVADPAGAVRGDPVAVALVVGTALSALALVALVVVFGARYGLAEPDRRE